MPFFCKARKKKDDTRKASTMYAWNPYAYPPYDPADDDFEQPVVLLSPLRSLSPSPRRSPYSASLSLTENYAYVQPGSHFVGVPMTFVPLPPNPSAVAATYAPLPPSPHVSPRLSSVPLSPQPAYMLQPHGYPFHPFFFVEVNAAPTYTSSRTRVHPLLLDGVYTHLNFASHTYLPKTPQSPDSDISLETLHPGYLVLPASYPIVTHMTIRCPAFKEFEDSWKIRIDLGRSISVGDVLRAMSCAMQRRVTDEEWADMSEREMEDANRAYTRRSRNFAFEKKKGMRRVDFLGESHHFGGMQVVREHDAHHFKLSVKEK